MKTTRLPNRKGLIGIILTCIVVTIIAGQMFREPSYQGKSLTRWVNEFDDSPEAQGALVHMGTNALPHLASQLAKQDSALKIAVLSWLSKQRWWKFRNELATERQGKLLIALRAIEPDRLPGEVLRPAIAKLASRFDETTHNYAIANALLLLGTNSTPALSQAIESTNRWTRIYAAVVLAKFDLPRQERGFAVQEQSSRLAKRKIKVVGFSFSDADLMALNKNLAHDKRELRRATAEAVAHFADADMPTANLKKLLSDSDPETRKAAEDARKKINGRRTGQFPASAPIP
jgi:hypothetical protein